MKRLKLALIIIFLTGAFTSKAQEKNQYMVIEFNYLLKKEIQISIDGKQYLEEEADYSPAAKGTHNVNPLLKQITKYESDGWELISFETLPAGGVYSYIAYLKKKKQGAGSK
jgi:hypothetical protein